MIAPWKGKAGKCIGKDWCSSNFATSCWEQLLCFSCKLPRQRDCPITLSRAPSCVRLHIWWSFFQPPLNCKPSLKSPPALFVWGLLFGEFNGVKLAFLYLNEEQICSLYMGSLVVFGGRFVVQNIHHIWKARRWNPHKMTVWLLEPSIPNHSLLMTATCTIKCNYYSRSMAGLRYLLHLERCGTSWGSYTLPECITSGLHFSFQPKTRHNTASVHLGHGLQLPAWSKAVVLTVCTVKSTGLMVESRII